MSEHHDPAAASNRSLELVTAAVLFALGVLMITDSLRLGVGWADDGPKAGYFPFYIGLILCFACLVNVINSVRDPQSKQEVFLTRHQLKMVMSLLLPTTVFVIAVGFLGLYLSAFGLIAWFMKRLGGFSWITAIAVSVGVPAFLYAMFEIWFGVPLPKGPIEQLLGLG